jgi:putative drug exporter of the RND superfamily
MDTPNVVRSAGIFERLADLVVRWPLLVIGFWIALAAVLALTLPPLPVVAARHQTETLPSDAPVVVTGKAMAEAFRETGASSMLLVVLTDEKGLGAGDEKTYRTLVDKLRRDTKDVQTVQDFLGTPQLREVLQSKDNKVWVLPVVLNGDAGTPESGLAYKDASEIVTKAVANSTLTANLTGPAATSADLMDISQKDLHLIESGTAIMVLLILLIVYRNPVTMLIPLIAIGISVAVAQGVLAGLGELGLGLTGETIVFMTGVMVGAGTDYAVFLISRYHDYVRQGADSDLALKRALESIGKVIAASAATVAVTFLAMIFARLQIFATVGPAISISVITAFLAAVSFLPAVLVVAGRRGWIRPRSDLTHQFWRRSGIRIVRRPGVHLVASLIVLAILASCASLAHYNYDDRKTLPGSVASATGFAALDRHLPLNSILPQYLFIQSPHDLRTPEALADLEQMARRVAQVNDVAMVRGITRPLGESLEQTKATYQAGIVGSKLDDASQQIAGHNGDLNRLTDGAHQLASSLGEVRDQVNESMGKVQAVAKALNSMENQSGGDKSLNDLIASMRAAAVSLNEIVESARGLGPAVTVLDGSLRCGIDDACVQSREQLRRLVAANDDGSLDKFSALARQLQSTAEALRHTLDTANDAMLTLSAANPSAIQQRLATMQDGANKLADGSHQLADGVQQLVDQTKEIGTGLREASAFLLGMQHGAHKASMSGFYIPPHVLKQNDFKSIADIFMSPDGHSTRYLIQTTLNPFTTAAMDQINAITNAARSAQPNTTLADAKISMTGMTVGLRDTRDYYNGDTGFIVVATIVIVLLILMVLLQAIVAPLYLILSVLVSYTSALGIGVIVFQFLLGQELHWSSPGLTFILLVAVGADYNLLLISRIRDESPHGVRSGVIRTVASTGAVITSAGLIFAASMFGLTFASITTMVQIGFIIGIGILLDTFLVRTITVPAVAAIVGQANWWPSRPVYPGEPATHMPILRRIRKDGWRQLGALLIGRRKRRARPRSFSTAAQRRRLRRHRSAVKTLATAPMSHQLNGDASNGSSQSQVVVLPTTADRGGHLRPEDDDDIPCHALPLFGICRATRLPDADGTKRASECPATFNDKGQVEFSDTPDRAYVSQTDARPPA